MVETSSSFFTNLGIKGGYKDLDLPAIRDLKEISSTPSPEGDPAMLSSMPKGGTTASQRRRGLPERRRTQAQTSLHYLFCCSIQWIPIDGITDTIILTDL